jgi:hypothetical protein
MLLRYVQRRASRCADECAEAMINADCITTERPPDALQSALGRVPRSVAFLRNVLINQSSPAPESHRASVPRG